MEDADSGAFTPAAAAPALIDDHTDRVRWTRRIGRRVLRHARYALRHHHRRDALHYARVAEHFKVSGAAIRSGVRRQDATSAVSDGGLSRSGIYRSSDASVPDRSVSSIGGAIICNGGYVWPGTARQGVCPAGSASAFAWKRQRAPRSARPHRLDGPSSGSGRHVPPLRSTCPPLTLATAAVA